MKGVYQQDKTDYPLYYQIFADELELHWQQSFYPSVADMQGLQAFAKDVILNEQGELSFNFNNINYKGMLNYLVLQDLANNELSIKEVNDLNSDSLADFEITYPSGQVQQLFSIN